MIRDDPFIVPPHIAALAHGPIYACRPDARQYTIPTRGQIRWHQVRSLLGWHRRMRRLRCEYAWLCWRLAHARCLTEEIAQTIFAPLLRLYILMCARHNR